MKKQIKMWAVPWDGNNGKEPVENGVFSLYYAKWAARQRMAVGFPIHVIVTIKRIPRRAKKVKE